jgi:hypothetical protein
MGVQVSITPTWIDFGEVAPFASGPAAVLLREFEQPNVPVFDGGFVIQSAPTDADVSLVLLDADAPASTFRIVALNTYDPRPGPAGQTFYDLAIPSDGSAPISVKAGQLVFIGATYSAPTQGGELAAIIVVNGSGWVPKWVMLTFSLPLELGTTLHAPSRSSLNKDGEPTSCSRQI